MVRPLLGGREGEKFDGVNSRIESRTNLTRLRKDLDSHLDEYAKRRTFPKARHSLALVAFVQDDETKQIMHAVTVEIPPAE